MAKERFTTCPSCEQRYDRLLLRCPHCHEANNDRSKTRMTFLPIPHQISLFLIGLIGLNVLSVIISIIAAVTIKEDDPLKYLLINSCSYSILFITDLSVINKYYYELLDPFKKGRTYIAGLVGFAFLLGGSLLISYLMSLMVPSAGTGENQSVAIAMVLRNPAVAILILGIIGPFVEECAYRLGLFSLCKRASRVLAYAVTTIVFATIHLNFFSGNIVDELVALPDYLFAGLMFSLLYDFEGFGASLIAHIGNNLFSIISIIITKGQ